MTLSEIESILGELAARHKNLNAAMLDTLLLSAGWEEKNIKEAQLLFKQGTYPQPKQETLTPQSGVSVSTMETPVANVPATDTPASHEEITFYQPDGTEEKELHAIVEPTNVPKRTFPPEQIPHLVTETPPSVEPVKEPIPPVVEQPIQQPKEKEVIPSVLLPESESILQKHYNDIEELTGERVSTPSPQERSFAVHDATTTLASSDSLQKPSNTLEKEPESLIQGTTSVPQKRSPTIKDAPIPEDLPLLPFESSPHVWSFSRYKNTFHKEASTTSVPVQPPPTPVVIPETAVTTTPTSNSEEEILLEKTPLTKGDESLIFLAGIMLLVIIIILGYMYSNGRL